MKSYIIDTHVLLWSISKPEALSEKVKKVFVSEKSILYCSTTNIWEMAIKISLQKLELPVSLKKLVNEHIVANKIELLGLKPEHTFRLVKLPFYHRDPFDRLLIAQALTEKLPIITKDSAFRKYDCEFFGRTTR